MRVGIWVPKEEKALVRELREYLDHATPQMIDDLKDFFRCTYEMWMNDPREPEEDRAFAARRFRDLGGAPAPSASEVGRDTQSR